MRQHVNIMAEYQCEKDHQWDFRADGLAYLYLDGENGSAVVVGQDYQKHWEQKGLAPINCAGGVDYSNYIGYKNIPEYVTNPRNNITYVVKKISKWAFYSALRVPYVSLPSTIEEIEDEAFDFTTLLTIIKLNEGLKKIGEKAFEHCHSINSVIIPDSVTSIGKLAFYQCQELTEVTIGRGITRMDQVFQACNSLKVITCRAVNPPVITERTFEDKVFENATLYVPFLSWETYKKHSKWGKFSKIEPIPETIPQNEIYYFAIDEFKRFMTKSPNSNEVYFAPVDNTKYINYNAGLIEIPSHVEYANKTYIVTGVGKKAFEKSTTATVKLPNTIKTICEDAFYLARIENINIPNSLEIIEEEAFQECEKLKEIEIPGSVTIGDRAFDSCTSLRRLTLHNGIKTIGEEAFTNCESLTEIEIPGSITSIGERIFQGCKSLKRIILHEGIERISEDAFEGATALQELAIPSTVVQIDGGAFSACGLNSPTRLALTIPDSVTTIDVAAFNACRIGELTLGKGLTRIEDRVFRRNELKDLVIPAGITSIGEKAFADNDNNFQTITCEGVTPPTIEEDSFDELTYKNALLRVPADAEDAYNDDPMWGKFRQIESI